MECRHRDEHRRGVERRSDNAADRTLVELFGRPLFDNAEPRPSGGDNVRFLARFARFLDPAEYAPGKRLTVYGRLAEPLTGKVGEYAYRYPVVDVEEVIPSKSQPDRGIVRFRYAAINQHDKEALSFMLNHFLRRRPA